MPWRHWFSIPLADAASNADGRQSGSSSADGSYAQIVGNGFSPNPGQCVIYSTSSKNYTQYRQIQVGLLRCNGINLAGTCPGGRTFIERYTGSA